MQRKQITPRVALAYQRDYFDPVPVFVLDTATLWSMRRGEHDGATYSYTFARSDGGRYCEDGFGRQWDGYLVARHREIRNYTRHSGQFAAASVQLSAFVDALPASLTPADVNALYTSTRPGPIEITVINNRYLIDTWEDWVEREAERERAAAERRRREEALLQWNAGNREALAEALGIEAKDLALEGYWRHASVRISMATLAAALGVELAPHPDQATPDAEQ